MRHAPRPVAPTTTTTSTPVAPPGWTLVANGTTGIAIDTRSFAQPDGSRVIVARFYAGQTRFALHVGSQDPPTGGAAIGPNVGPAISLTERPTLLAAFNGGFETSTGTGGFEVNGHILRSLTSGTASFAIDTSGAGHVGVWGQDLPKPGESIASVRQNLSPLVRNAQPSSQISQISAWGPTLGHRARVARSALGEDSQRNILFAASMAAVPADLSTALIDAGTATAMELDINPQWVQLALTTLPGGPLVPGLPDQHRPADQYITGWTRDFFTVSAATTQP